MPKNLYRPQGTDPKGAEVGGYRIGEVHRNVPDSVATALMGKRFVEVPATFNPGKDPLPGTDVVTDDEPATRGRRN